MQNWEEEYRQKCTTAAAAVREVRSGDTVYLGTATSMAHALSDALGERTEELEDVTLTCSNVLEPLRPMQAEGKNAFRICSYFMGGQERAARSAGLSVDYTSVHLSQVDLFHTRTRPPRVAFFQVSPPDAEGYMSFGATGVAINKYIQEAAEVILAEVNPHVPFVCGEDNKIHISAVQSIVEDDRPLFELPNLPVTEDIRKISDFLLEQIPDGACIQLGIGGVANAVGFGLKQRNDLGCHTELVTDSIMELMKLGVLNNKYTGFLPGKTVGSFAMGTAPLYTYIDRNEDFCFLPFPIVNDPVNIAKNDRMISINTALSADVFGQICADNIAGRQFSATGGQLDFVRGAQMAKDGKSFIAFPATGTNKKGERYSKIVARLPFGAAVTTPRSDVQYVVTEYGCVNLKERSMKERVEAMIHLAHPDFRMQLREEVKQSGIFA